MAQLIASVRTALRPTGGTSGPINSLTANLLIVIVNWIDVDDTGIRPAYDMTDTYSNAWITNASLFYKNATTKNATQAWYKRAAPVSVGASHRIDILLPTNANPVASFYAFKVDSVDVQFRSVVGNTNANNGSQAGLLVPPGNENVLVAGLNGGTSTAMGIDLGYTQQQLAYALNNNVGSADAYLIQSTGAPVNPTWSMTGGTNGTSIHILFGTPTGAPSLEFTASAALAHSGAILLSFASAFLPAVSGSAALVHSGTALIASASTVPPTFDSNAALVHGGATLDADAAITAPEFSVSAVLVHAGAIFESTMNVDAPGFSAHAILTHNGTLFTATGTTDVPVYEAVALMQHGGAVIAASATHTLPTYSAGAALQYNGMVFTAGGMIFAPQFQATALLVHNGPTIEATGDVAAPGFSAYTLLHHSGILFLADGTTMPPTFSADVMMQHSGAVMKKSTVTHTFPSAFIDGICADICFEVC